MMFFRVKAYHCFTFLGLLLALGSFCAQAQHVAEQYDRSYSVKHYNDQNGLPQNSVKSIAPDPDGFVWLATESGLARFDGNKFYVYNKSNTGMSSNRLFELQPDMTKPFNRLYARFNKKQFLRIANGKAVVDSTIDNHIVLTLSNGMADSVNSYLTTGTPLWWPETFKPKTFIIPVGKREGCYFICENEKLEFYSNWQKVREIGIRRTNYWDLFRIGNSIFVALDNGKYRNVFGEKKAEKNVGPKFSEFLLSGAITKDPDYSGNKKRLKIYWNNAVDQVFVTLNNSLYQVREIAGRKLDTELILSGFDLGANHVSSIYYDSSGQRLFLGSNTKGLFVIKKKRFDVLFSSREGGDNVFYAQTAFDNNSIQTPDGVILGKAPGARESIIERKLAGVRKNMLEFRILKDHQSNIWTVSGTHIFCFAEDGVTLKGKWDMQSEISDIHLGLDNGVWIAMTTNLLYRVSTDKPASQPLLFANLNLPEKRIGYLLQATEDSLWIGTNQGLYSFQIASRKLNFIKQTAQYDIRSLYISPTPGSMGALWVASYNNGLALYKNQTLTTFPLDRENYLAASHDILEDEKGFFWIPTNKGLFQIKKKDLLDYAGNDRSHGPPFYMYYNVEEGFNTNEFNGGCRPCVVRLPNGYVSLPSLNGLVWFNPEKFVAELPDKRIFIDRVEANGINVSFSAHALSLSQDHKEYRIFVTTPFFGNTDNLHLSYALTGRREKAAASDWIEIDSKTGLITISRLENGKYTLHIRKRNGFGTDNFSFEQIAIDVPPLWYETWCFRSMVTGIILLFLYRLFRIQTRNIKRRNMALEAKVAERTQDLQAVLHSLKSSENELTQQVRLYIRMIASISHDVRTPINYIGKATDHVESLLADKQIEAAVRINAMIGLTSRRIFGLLENMIVFTKSEMFDSRLTLKNTDLQMLLTEKAEMFEAILLTHRAKLHIEVPPGKLVHTNPKLLAVMIHNLIDNAIKIRWANRILLHIAYLEGRLHLIVSDEGPGMPAELLEWLNTPPSSIDGDTRLPEKYDGLGLLMVREIAQILGITIYVEVGNGTHFHLIFGHSESLVSTQDVSYVKTGLPR